MFFLTDGERFAWNFVLLMDAASTQFRLQPAPSFAVSMLILNNKFCLQYEGIASHVPQ
jgi:hypothetical protein